MFDRDQDGCLNYSEFLSLILPSLERNHPSNCRDSTPGIASKLPFDIEYALVKIIRTEIQLQKNLEILKRDIMETGLDAVDLFRTACCFDNNRASIDEATLRAFMFQHEAVCNGHVN